jgi:acyl carrier protein
MNDTFERVRGVIAETMNVNPDRVTPDTDVQADLGPDSLEQVEIVMGLEKVFNLDLGDEPGNFGKVSEVVTRIDTVLTDRESQYH